VRVFEGALDEFSVLARLLGSRQGERYATDLRHLTELCHAEERRTRVGPSGLATWLRAARDSTGGGEDEAEALRLESDARAVQLVTIHKSKGLEYPVVLLPFVWDERQPRAGDGPVEWHANVGGRSEIRLNLEGRGSGDRDRAEERSVLEARQEQARLLYVALTRARHHCVAWLGPLGQDGSDTGSHAMGRLALRPRSEEGEPSEGERLIFPAEPKPHHRTPEKVEAYMERSSSTWSEASTRFDRLARGSRETIGWSVALPPAAPARIELERPPLGELSAQPWPVDRRLSSPWMVSSYSAMVAGRTFDASEPQRPDERQAGAGRVAANQGADLDPQVELPEPTVGSTDLGLPIESAKLRGGTEVGTWAHAVLEHLDFQRCRGSDDRELTTLLAELGTRHGIRSTVQQGLLADALPKILATPLGGGATGLAPRYSLSDLQPHDRLDELGFDLRLGAGNRWQRGASRAGGLVDDEGARVALERRLRAPQWHGRDWLEAILERTKDGGRHLLPRIAGVLTGFIDLVFRVEKRTDAGETTHRYFLSDYKTNRIAPPSQRRDSRRFHYTQPWLAWEMAHHGYHLQALLYTVALHRLLKQRLADYDYQTHIGGHLYLFLRGMEGEAAPRDQGMSLGVYFDRWPASVVLGLDAALCGAGADEVREIVDDFDDFDDFGSSTEEESP
jgi:exodeoxyribonuclease V beta subunit